MKINLYLASDFKDIFQKWEEVPIFKTVDVEENIDLWNRSIILDDKNYCICSKQGNNYSIRELEYLKVDEDIKDLETYGEDDIKCPVCGCEISDSWEYSEDDGKEICDGCGATLEWTREIEVSYSTSVKEIVEPIKL